MRNDILESPLAGLTLITSCGCNLDCEYCRIAQARHENSNAAELQSKTIQALQDGTFLKNSVDVLYKLEQSPSNITSIAFWGQEPTLTIHLMAEHIADWFAAYPNWCQCSFSTNAIAYMDRLYDFIVAIDQNVKHPFSLDIQLSYDGEYGTTTARKTSGANIHDNVKYLFEKLNQVKFRYLTLNFHFHAVLSLDLIYKLQDINELVQYQKSLIQWTNEFTKINNNRNITVSPTMDLGLENPVKASAADGLALHRLCETSKRLEPTAMFDNEFFKDNEYYNIYTQACQGAFMLFDSIDRLAHEMFGVNNLDELIDVITDNTFARRDFFRQMNPMCFCGNGVGEVKIMYDGTLANCQNHIYDLDLNELPMDNNNLDASVKRSLVQHHYFINPLYDDEDIIQKYFDLFRTMNFGGLEFLFRSTIQTMSALVQLGQIDASYYDSHKLIKHGIILAILSCCSYNNQMMTGSLFLRPTGFLRFYCNGFLDDCIDCFNEMKGGLVI